MWFFLLQELEYVFSFHTFNLRSITIWNLVHSSEMCNFFSRVRLIVSFSPIIIRWKAAWPAEVKCIELQLIASKRTQTFLLLKRECWMYKCQVASPNTRTWQLKKSEWGGVKCKKAPNKWAAENLSIHHSEAVIKKLSKYAAASYYDGHFNSILKLLNNNL
jgi:hypothetical protein